MNEASIRDFFEGALSAPDLDRVWATAFVVESRSGRAIVRRLKTVDLPAPYSVTPSHVTALVDAVRAGELSLAALDAICFALEASDQFEWDTDEPAGERVGKALFWLGTPEINYPLTPAALAGISAYLATGDESVVREDLWKK